MRLAANAAHEFGGIALDRGKPFSFRLNGRRIDGFTGDTVFSAVVAVGIDTYGAWFGTPIGLGERFAPLVSSKRTGTLPMDRTPAVDGLDLVTVGARKRTLFKPANDLQHGLESVGEPEWLRSPPVTTLSADLLVIGAGVAGLAAAEAAAADGRTVLLVERRPWLGGDARYFGAVGDDESPEALTTRLIASVSAQSAITILSRAEAFALQGGRALVHQVEMIDGVPTGRVVAITAGRVVLATGAQQRLPIFPGNRAPGVVPSISAYHLAKRYGASFGKTAVLATQSNYGYRLGLRLHDAGVNVLRVVDTRINPQSRFVDFAKATGLTLASGQLPLSAERGRFSFGHSAGPSANSSFAAEQLIVAGAWQPDLSLWMLGGGSVSWDAPASALKASGVVEHLAIAGSAAGYRTLRACAESGRAAVRLLFGATPGVIEDAETGIHLETPDAATSVAPPGEAPSFLDMGRSLATRPAGDSSTASLPRSHALSLGEVAASVELGLIGAGDAGAIAEERGAPGPDIHAAKWTPIAQPATEELPPYLRQRFGEEPSRVHLIVDKQRTFETGALVYSNASTLDPEHALGVVVEIATTGGIALMRRSALNRNARFVVVLDDGPSPARIATD